MADKREMKLYRIKANGKKGLYFTDTAEVFISRGVLEEISTPKKSNVKATSPKPKPKDDEE